MPDGVDLTEPLARAAAILSEATEVALACHINPDADALGSMLGLSAFLRSRDVTTVCSFPNEPQEPPRWASLLPGSEDIVGVRDFPKRPAVMVTCDCADLARLGPLATPAERATELIWIDHHRSNPGLGTVSLIDPDASSTCEVVFRLVETMGGEVPAATAIGLYAGLVTDTGRFQYEATTPETLRVAARLREHEFDHTGLVQALYEDNRVGYLRLLGTVMSRLAVEPLGDADGAGGGTRNGEAGELVWTYVTQADLRAAGVRSSDTEDLIDLVRTARGVDVAAVLKQQGDGRFKVSMRSRGAHDLAATAAAFGGGGHRLAAGYTSSLGPEGTIAALREALVTNRSSEPSA